MRRKEQKEGADAEEVASEKEGSCLEKENAKKEPRC